MPKAINLKKSFSVYFISTFIEKGIGFLLIPILTVYISPQGIGKLSLITSTILFLTPLVSLNTSAAIYVEYFRETDKSIYKRYFSTALLLNFTVFCAFFLIVLLGIDFLKPLFDCPVQWVIAIPIFCLLDTIKVLVLNLLQIQKKPIVYGIVGLLYSILNFCISLLLVYNFQFDYEGRLWGMLIAGSAIFLFSFYLFYKNDLLTFQFKTAQLVDILKYGIPLLPHAFGYLVLDLADRFFIKYFAGEEALGIYSVAYLLGSAVYILASVFNTSYTPHVYEALKKNQPHNLLKIAISYVRFSAVMLVISIMYILFSKFIYLFLIDEKYYSGIKYLPFIVFGYYFMSLYLVFANILFYYKRNYIFGIVAIFNIILNIGLNYFLIKSFGAMGAAWATCISMFIFMIVIAGISNKVLKLPWLQAFKFAFQFRKLSS